MMAECKDAMILAECAKSWEDDGGWIYLQPEGWFLGMGPQPYIATDSINANVRVCFERRPDGGLRAWSDQVPGFVLSHHDVDKLIADIKPALETILSAYHGDDGG